MRVRRIDVSGLLEKSEIRIVGVQLRSPFDAEAPELVPFPTFEQFGWMDRARSVRERLRKIEAILDRIQQHAYFKPDIIVFPEYAVPRECHDKLREFSAKERCIVVAGSYYETERQHANFRANLCKLFVPAPQAGQASSEVLIAKKTCYQGECALVAVPDDLPNVARLEWQAPGGRRVAISVYICKDYLVPYEIRGSERVSVLDWDHSGMSVVVMCAGDTRLFKALGAFEVRRLRGDKGRFVFLCNCSGKGVDGAASDASALLGPARQQQRVVEDTVVDLPADVEGLIWARVDLQDVEVRRTVPNTETHDPVLAREALRFHWEGELAGLKLLPSPGRTQVIDRLRERGVWKPAFLKAMNRRIVLKLLTADDVVRARDLLRGERIRWVTAASIRGVHDFLVTYYAQDGKVPLRFPYSSLTDEERDKMFEKGSELTFVVDPENIFKFRDVVIEKRDRDGQAREMGEIDTWLRSLSRTECREVVRRACELARDWQDRRVTDEERAALGAIFYERLETAQVVDTDELGLRQAFVLVGILSDKRTEWRQFETEIVEGWLCQQPEVRSIYRLEQVGGSAPRWDYWLDIVASPRRTDDIVDELHDRCAALGIKTASRTVERRYYLKLESVEGMALSERFSDVIAFLIDARPAGAETSKSARLSDERMTQSESQAARMARAYWGQMEEVTGALKEEARRFYGSWFLANFADSERVRGEELDRTKSIWRGLYESVEAMAQDLVERLLGGEYMSVITRHADERKRPDRAARLRENAIMGLFELAGTATVMRDEVKDTVERLGDQFGKAQVFSVRADLSHAQRHITALDVTIAGGEDRNVQRVSSALAAIIDAVPRLRMVQTMVGGAGAE